MNRSGRLLPLVACFIAAAAPALAASHLPKSNTRHAISRYVEEAAKIVEKSGPSCETLESKQWRGGDYYIFVLGPDGKTLCHPRSEMVGKPASSIVNAGGVKVGEMIAAKGNGSGKGWVEYAWPRPGQTAEEPKSTYVMGVTGPDGAHYTVGAGGWNVTK
jgi:cytochrome c